ncbi:hypothetical protein F8388_013552 [Cannabis sativa]|uniref:RNase H type-1 domain-containing protein n=1 Tax=Cannabis sativa TaxID=3483 RepID=A0A7J6G8S9_CANSA|nr:hypothetical protein F8388_013552 [Cannabis sativa]
MADIGPTRDQLVERPREEICRSRVPHQHPKPVYATWPTDKTLDEVVNELMDPCHESVSTQKIVTHDCTEFSNMGPSLSESKKRKACMTLIPVIDPRDKVVDLGLKTGSCPVTFLPPLQVNAYTLGSSGTKDGKLTRRKNPGRNSRGDSNHAEFNPTTGANQNQGNRVSIEHALKKLASRYEETTLTYCAEKEDLINVRSDVRRTSTLNYNTSIIFLVDASWKEGNAGLAVILFDPGAHSWTWSAKSCKADSAVEAEVLPIFWALQLSKDKGHESVTVLSDAQVVANALQARRCPPVWEVRSLAMATLNLLN